MYNGLKKWCEKYNIIQRSVENFWENFELFHRDSPDEFEAVFYGDIKNAGYKIAELSYKMALPDCDYVMVYVTLDILSKNEKVGWFRQIYSYEDGSEFDEYFVLYD